MTKNNPIGIFDSGVGGTSVWKEIYNLLPNENTIYLADSKNAPYGNRPQEEIINLSIKNTKVLIEMGCKIVVVACNTATTNAISMLRKTFDTPIIGIEPAIKPAALNTTSGKIGILATKGTLGSSLFAKTSKEFSGNAQMIEVIGEGLVPLIEAGDLESDHLRALLIQYVKPMIEAEVDYVVLGCTHYPYLIPLLKEILPSEVTIIDSGKAVARQTQSILLKENLLQTETTNSKFSFYSNGDLKTLKFLLKPIPHNAVIKTLDF